MQVAVTGATAARVAQLARQRGRDVLALVAADSADHLLNVLPADAVLTWVTREDLDVGMQRLLQQHPMATVFLSAAINDYHVSEIHWIDQSGEHHSCPAGTGKVPSGAEQVDIRLRPAPKLIAQLGDWGHAGRLFACKYSPAATVVAQAKDLWDRHHAAGVLANSLDGSVQALVAGDGSLEYFPSREEVLAALVDRLVML
jgi:hypothetical protein